MWRDAYCAVMRAFDGQQALQQAAEQNRLERYFTFPNFARSAERCGDQLHAVGLSDVAVESFPADGVTSWSGWRSMKAWDVTEARLWITEPSATLLCDWSALPESLVMYSGSCDVEGELVEWNGEDEIELTGRIPFTNRRISDLFAQMRRRGVRGIVSDFLGTLPGVRDPWDLPDAVRWENSALRLGAGAHWGFMLSPRQGQWVRSLLRQGPVRLRASVSSRVYDGSFHSATGLIPGASERDTELVFVSHLYEPGANDNASGVGIALELARSLNSAIRRGLLPRPRRSIRFLFHWEGYGLCAWLHRHADRVSGLLGGLNIDEVGVDQEQGASVLHLFMPPAANPSCTGHFLAHLCREAFAPDLRWKAVADRADIINDTLASDPHLDVPLPTLIQYPSRCYHSSADRLPTLSAPVMARVACVSGTYMYCLAAAEGVFAAWLARLVADGCRQQWQRTERRLLDRSWPFDAGRTRAWFAEQAALSTASVERFGLSAADVLSLQGELQRELATWCSRWQSAFPPAEAGDVTDVSHPIARGLVLERTTPACPKVWSLSTHDPEDEQRYRALLCRSNLDLLCHRILYWADGRRSLADIMERLAFEWDELRQETSISRTSTGAAIDASPGHRVDAADVLALVERIVAQGYLKASVARQRTA